MNILDIILLVLIALSVIGGIQKGFFKSLFDMLGVVISIVLTYFNYDILENQLLASSKFTTTINDFFVSNSNWFMNIVDNNEINFFTKLLGGLNINQATSSKMMGAEDLLSMFASTMTTITVRLISIILTFLVIYLVLLIVFSILNKIMEIPGLNILNRCGGAIVGFLKASLIIFIALSLIVPLVRTIAPEEEIAKEDQNIFYGLTTEVNSSKIVDIALGDKSITESISDGFGIDLDKLINEEIKTKLNIE